MPIKKPFRSEWKPEPKILIDEIKKQSAECDFMLWALFFLMLFKIKIVLEPTERRKSAWIDAFLAILEGLCYGKKGILLSVSEKIYGFGEGKART